MLADGETPDGGAHVEDGRIASVVYVGMITRYHVALDAGGELMVVSQNLEVTSTEALAQQGRRVRLQWRPEHTFTIDGSEEEHRMTGRTKRFALLGGTRAAGRRSLVPRRGLRWGRSVRRCPRAR